MRYRKSIEDTVDMTVVALCADFGRRSLAIREKRVTHRTEMEYRYLNFKILSAAEEIMGEGLGENIIEEIGYGVGYAHSYVTDISESTYKDRKLMVKENIAKKLHLID
ncbi:MAG: hypothetical protein IJY69_01595 [Clostridia bacterium]|nr:hypothetical protein [Clostridia bacterium]